MQELPVIYRRVFPDNMDRVFEWDKFCKAVKTSALKFRDIYKQAVFPDADVEQLMRWSDFDDIFQQAKDITPPYRIVISHLSMRFPQQRFFVTEEIYTGYGMNNVEPGDCIYQVQGCSKMLVFRPFGLKSPSNSVTLLGACYAMGLGDEYDNDPDGEYEEISIF